MEHSAASRLRTNHIKDDESKDKHLNQDNDLDAVSLDEWITMNRLSFYRDKLKDCVSSVAELRELDSTEIEEVVRLCGMKLVFL